MIVVLLLLSASLQAHWFVPENDLWIVEDEKSLMSGKSEAKFNAIIDAVVKVYRPIIKAKGKKLNVIRKFKSGTVNAYASQSADTWNIAMFGGLFRHRAINYRGFALVVCHELGHHLAGSPTYNGRWASVEGQSDYFATAKCLRRAYTNLQKHMGHEKAPSIVKRECAANFSGARNQRICEANAMAGRSGAALFQALRGRSTPPSFTNKDTAKVAKTFAGHPAYQCRMDTYYAGAKCSISSKSYKSCTRPSTARPRCWFKP